MQTARILLIGLVLACGSAQAVVVENLHRALVDVQDHSNAQLQQATRRGLEQVLVKVSGSASVLQSDEARAALDQAPRFMQRYQYLRPDDDSLKLQVHFDPQLVNDLLRDAQAPLWTANRPPLLVWIAVDDAGGRHTGTPESDPELYEQLRLELERRGVPATYPLYDLQDTMAINLPDLWRLDELALLRASERYGVTNVLAGRLTAMPDGRWQGDWVYLFNDQRTGASFYGEELPVFTADAVDFVADRMASRYAVSGENQALSVLVRVDALADFADYRRVLEYFQSIELVDDTWPAYLEGDSVVFRLASQAEPEQLHRIVQLNRGLERLDAPPPLRRGPIKLDLVYRWNP